jgi:predicted nucleotidyltransferase
MPASSKDIWVARELKNKVLQFTRVIDFRIFGSRARGDAEEFSDLDIFMELESVDGELKKKVKNAAWEMTMETGVLVTTLLFSRHDMEHSPLRSSPIVRVIMEEGVPI